MQRMRRALFLKVIACSAGLLIAASCREKAIGETAKPSGPKQERPRASQIQPKEPPFTPQVAGAFYPDSPGKLRQMIREHLEAARKDNRAVEGDLLGIMVPHAGYPYSGPVAAFAFGALEGRSYKRVVVLGPAHRRRFSQPALLDAAAYHTPLGDIPIDQQGVRKLAKTGAARVDPSKFLTEHALEVELPFLQVALSSFELVPIMISEPDPTAMKKLARALIQVFPGKDTLFVASTDMSHDYPYDVAVAMDENALRYITALDTQGLAAAAKAHRKAGASISVGDEGRPSPDCTQLCGMGPVLALMEVARLTGEAKVQVLDRRNSGDIVGDRSSRIVGYFSAAVVAGRARKAASDQGQGATGDDFLNQEEKQALLDIARQTLHAYLGEGRIQDFDPQFPKLKNPGAAFVTLKKDGRLKGCIGHMEPTDPLWKMIRDRAIDAAVHDRRFRAVKKEELDDITIEISVLSPRMKVKDPLTEIVIGRDGAWIELGSHRGVFLPQVPVEQNWKTVEEYLDNLCRKAHLPNKGCWKSPQAAIQRFTALVFSEEH